MINQKAIVIRDGLEKETEIQYLSPGDVVKLKPGLVVPADLRILESLNLKVDNSLLTGEPEPQERVPECTNEKSALESKNLAFFGTTVVQGYGKGVVISIGDSTLLGCISRLATLVIKSKSLFELEISRLVKVVLLISLCTGIFFFSLSLMIGYNITTDMQMTVGIVIGIIPEGLMIILLSSLIISWRKMEKQNILVKNLKHVESLGSISCICSDKTGTLTENKMTLVGMWYDLKSRDVHNFEDQNLVENLGYSPMDSTFKFLQYCATLSNSAKWNFIPSNDYLYDTKGNYLPTQEVENITERYREKFLTTSSKDWPVLGGDASEIALIRFFQPIYDVDALRKKYPIMLRYGIRVEIPFRSPDKFGVTLHEPVDFGGIENRNDCLIFMKGAPEEVWKRCDFILIDGISERIDEGINKEYEKANHLYASSGKRVLGMAMMWLPGEDYDPEFAFLPMKKEGPNFPLTGLTFIGLCAFEDPPKPKVKEAVEKCQQAGIKVIMITGDQPLTATAIAREVSIITCKQTANEISEENDLDLYLSLEKSDAVIVHGEELSRIVEQDKHLPLEDQRLTMILHKNEIVFARTTPAQKYLIVNHLQSLGHIVAVTGDGVNDCPAIKQADIGIAMGISGSQATKEAADMLLLDDNFYSIVSGIEEGRKFYHNIKKCLIYTLSVNMAQLLPFVALIIFQIPVPLSPVLMMVMCLLTEIFPALSLIYESPEDDVMNKSGGGNISVRKRLRKHNREHLITWDTVLFAYFQMGVIQAMAGFFAYFTVMRDYGFSPRVLWKLGFYDEGTKPDDDDFYIEDHMYKGNSNVGIDDNELVKVDWFSTAHGGYDLRVWFWNLDGWNECVYPEDRSNITGKHVCYTTEALKYAQFAYFLAVIVVQCAHLFTIISRKQSIWNYEFRHFYIVLGVTAQICIAVAIGFIPGLDLSLGGRSLHFLHFFVPGLPFFIIVFVCDEMKKMVARYLEKNKRMKRKIRARWFVKGFY